MNEAPSPNAPGLSAQFGTATPADAALVMDPNDAAAGLLAIAERELSGRTGWPTEAAVAVRRYLESPQ